MAFKFSDMVNMGKTLNVLTVYDYGSIFKSQRVIMFQMNFVYTIFLEQVHWR